MEPQYASGFGEALSAFLSRGGSVRTNKHGSRFMGTRGDNRLKGLTVGEATNQAKVMWSNAPDSVKEKYASMAGEGRLAPSEMAAFQERQRTRTDNSGGQHDHTRLHVGGDPAPVGEQPVQPVNPNATTGAGRGTPVQAPQPPTSPQPVDDGNMDDEIASMTTPEMKSEMAAQLQAGEGMAMASTFGAAGMWGGTQGNTSPLSRRLEPRAEAILENNQDAAAEAGYEDQVAAAREARHNTQQEEIAENQDASRRNKEATILKRAGNLDIEATSESPVASQPPPTSSTEPRPGEVPNEMFAPAPDMSGQSTSTPQSPPARDDAYYEQAAREAGYAGKNAVAQFKRDHGTNLPELETEESRADYQAKLARPARGSMANPIRFETPGQREAEAALRPGMQRQIAQNAIATRQSAPLTDADNARGKAAQALAERQRNPGLNMNDVRGLGEMAAWGINPRTGGQLTREGVAELRGQQQPAFAGGGVQPPSPRPRTIGSRR